MARSKFDGPFVGIHADTMDSPAWRATSKGARVLYLHLLRRVPNDHNVAFLSQRQAQRELRSGRTEIGNWFRELEHYGFIVEELPTTRGGDGKGKAPHWRVTERGSTRKTSPTGVRRDPTKDFKKWDGTPFRGGPETRSTQNKKPGPETRSTVVQKPGPPLVQKPSPPKPESGPETRSIQHTSGGPETRSISSKPSGVAAGGSETKEQKLARRTEAARRGTNSRLLRA